MEDWIIALLVAIGLIISGCALCKALSSLEKKVQNHKR